jgi:hypothetical protein
MQMLKESRPPRRAVLCSQETSEAQTGLGIDEGATGRDDGQRRHRMFDGIEAGDGNDAGSQRFSLHGQKPCVVEESGRIWVTEVQSVVARRR